MPPKDEEDAPPTLAALLDKATRDLEPITASLSKTHTTLDKLLPSDPNEPLTEGEIDSLAYDLVITVRRPMVLLKRYSDTYRTFLSMELGPKVTYPPPPPAFSLISTPPPDETPSPSVSSSASNVSRSDSDWAARTRYLLVQNGLRQADSAMLRAYKRVVETEALTDWRMKSLKKELGECGFAWVRGDVGEEMVGLVD